MENPQVNIEIWIASHVHSQQRFEWAKEMLLSLSLQTSQNFKVYLSWSKEKYVIGELGDMAIKLLGNKVIVSFHELRKTQFEHIKSIFDSHNTQNSGGNKLLYVLFCDDDDMYHKFRVERIMDTIMAYPETKFFRDHSVIILGKDKVSDYNEKEIEYQTDTDIMKNPKYAFSDFANNVCTFDLIDSFFKERYDDENTYGIHGMTDCIFSHWLKFSTTKNTYINEVLYLKRTERLIPTKTMCWDKKKDFEFEKVVDKWKLNEIFFEMSDLNFFI